MRVGLVAVGAAFSVVGAAVIVGILYPGDDPTVSRSSLADADGLAKGDWKPFVLPASASSPATVTLTWVASTGDLLTPAAVNVSFYSAHACPPAADPCLDSPVLASWTDQAAGRWSASGGSGSLYVLYVDVSGSSNSTVNFSATFAEQYRTGPMPLPMLAFSFTMVGGGLLTGVGAVALYLGLFLPAGVYAPSSALGPEGDRTPDDDAGTPPPGNAMAAEPKSPP